VLEYILQPEINEDLFYGQHEHQVHIHYYNHVGITSRAGPVAGLFKAGAMMVS